MPVLRLGFPVMIALSQQFAIQQGITKRPFVNVGNVLLPGCILRAPLLEPGRAGGLSLRPFVMCRSSVALSDTLRQLAGTAPDLIPTEPLYK